jgi:hypothetical protein
MLESTVGMPRVRVYLSPAAFFAALILLWTVAVYLGFFVLPGLPLSPYGVFMLFLTVLAWLSAVALTVILVLASTVS